MPSNTASGVAWPGALPGVSRLVVPHVTDFPARLLTAKEVPEWASGDLAPATAQPIKSYINGDGITYEFVLFVVSDRARAAAVSAAIEGG